MVMDQQQQQQQQQQPPYEIVLRCDAFSTSFRTIHGNKYDMRRIGMKETETSILLQYSKALLSQHKSNTLPFITSRRYLYPFDHSSLYDANQFISSSVIVSDEINSWYTFSVPFIVVVAITIGVLANGWISRLITSERGLGSFLSDGSGYNKSKFKPLQQRTNKSSKNDDDRAVQDDPLPWLRLPNFDFVEVAGQQNQRRKVITTYPPITDDKYTSKTARKSGSIDTTKDTTVTTETSTIALEELELLRLRMQEQVLLKNYNEAQRLSNQLERLMKENNIQFTNEGVDKNDMDPFL